MSEYTVELIEQAEHLDMDIDDIQRSRVKLEIIQKEFRPFEQALGSFLQKKFDLSSTNPNTLQQFTEQKYRDSGIRLPRTVKKWFVEPISIERKTAFQLCFVFGLDVEESNLFFKKIYLQRSFNCRNVEEAIYYYCIFNQKPYSDALDLFEKIPGISKEERKKWQGEQTVVYTSNIMRDIEELGDQTALFRYMEENRSYFCYNHVRAIEMIRQLWNRITDPEHGLIFDDRFAVSLMSSRESSRKALLSEWDVLLLIFGLNNEEWERIFYAKRGNPNEDRRNVRFLLETIPIHQAAKDNFPDRDGLQKILRGEYGLSDERIRKTLILLKFYQYWISVIKNNYDSYQVNIHDWKIYMAEVNQFLLDAGFAPFYEGNPYDWIFYWASCQNDVNPIQAFRDLITSGIDLKN